MGLQKVGHDWATFTCRPVKFICSDPAILSTAEPSHGITFCYPPCGSQWAVLSSKANLSSTHMVHPQLTVLSLEREVFHPILLTWWEKLTHWKRPWCWGRLRAEGEGLTENEMTGWHHRLNGHKFEQALGGRGQGSLACCNSWGYKEWDTTGGLNNNNR